MKQSKREEPSEWKPSARRGGRRYGSSFDGIGAVPVVAFRRGYRQAQFLAYGPGQEAADRVRLPAARFLQFFTRCPAGPLQQVQDLGGLAAVPDVGLADLGFFAPFGAFLARLVLVANLDPPDATLARRAPGLALFVTFGTAAALAAGVSGCSVLAIMFSPLAVITALTT